MNNPTFKELYQRQIILNEVGENGQKALQEAKVLIVGCGGLGSTAAVYLAASGIGSLELIDFDTVAVSNLHRQVFYTLEDIGKPKVSCLKRYIKKSSSFVNVTENQIAVNKNNIHNLLKNVNIILDCTDDLHIKYLLNDACVLYHKTLVYGSLHKFDGYVATFNYDLGNGKRTANLRDAFPKIPKKLPPTCAEAGTLNTIVGIIALHQANEVLKLVLKKGNLLTDKIFIYNSLYHTSQTIHIKKNSESNNMQSTFENENYEPVTCKTEKKINAINGEDFWEKMKEDKVVVLSFCGKLPGNKYNDKVIRIPYISFDPFRMPIKQDHDYILICSKGTLSYDAGISLLEAHPELSVYNLERGTDELKK